MEGYTKLFSGIVTSTLWSYDSDTRVVWVTLLALADQHGNVVGTVPGISHLARVDLDKTREALERFATPDPDSGTSDFEGRRIEKIDRGWHLLTHGKYRALRSKDEKAAYDREYQANRRAKKSGGSTDVVSGSQKSLEVVKIVHAEAEAEAEADRTYGGGEAVVDSKLQTPSIPRPVELTSSAPPWPVYEKKASVAWLLERWPSNGRNVSRHAAQTAAEKSISARDWSTFEAATRARLRNVEESIASDGPKARTYYPGLVKWFETWRDYPIPPEPAITAPTAAQVPKVTARPIAEERFSD